MDSSDSEFEEEQKIPNVLNYSKFKKFDQLLEKIKVKNKQKVVTRFVIEPSSYLHLGHLKNIYLNYALAKKHKGKFIIRIDDSNPLNILQLYEFSILQDLDKLGVVPDVQIHTSRHFKHLLYAAETLIDHDMAYVDDTPIKQINDMIETGTETEFRTRSIGKNQDLWQQMLKGEITDCCLRLKIQMDHKNKKMRDPIIYQHIDVPEDAENQRSIAMGYEPKYTDMVYPTRDFACPLIDSWDGVSHVFRSDDNELYSWILNIFRLASITLIKSSHLKLPYTVMSKDKLLTLVNKNIFNWDDPRMPTLRGLFNRGITVAAMIKFVTNTGISSSKQAEITNWDKLWNYNKEILDFMTPHYSSLIKDNQLVTLIIKDFSNNKIIVPNHPKNSSLGNKIINLTIHESYNQNESTNLIEHTVKVVIDQIDANKLVIDKEYSLYYLGNIMITDIIKTKNNQISEIHCHYCPKCPDLNETVINWLPTEEDDNSLINGWIYRYQHILSVKIVPDGEDWLNYIDPDSLIKIPILLESSIKQVKIGQQVQLHGRGYYRRMNVEKELVFVEYYKL